MLRAAAAEIRLLQCANGWRREVALTPAWSGGVRTWVLTL